VESPSPSHDFGARSKIWRGQGGGAPPPKSGVSHIGSH